MPRLPAAAPALASAPCGGVTAATDVGGVQLQTRSLSRSVRDAQVSCTSEAGAASIAAILQCVAHAQDLPVQQQPNSEKWTGRLKAYEVERRRFPGM